MMWEMIKNHLCMLKLKATLADWNYKLTTRPMKYDDSPEEYTIKLCDGEFVYYIREVIK